MMDDETSREIVEGLCDLLETEPLRLMDPRVDEAAQNLADLLEEAGRSVAAERFRLGWKTLREQFKKTFQNVRPGSKDHAFDSPPKQPVMMGLPPCVRCRKGVADYDTTRGTYDWMLCEGCRALGNGPELAPALEAEISRMEPSVALMSSNLAHLKERLRRSLEPHE